MSTKKKLLLGSAGAAAAGGAGLDVDEVFSTYLYTGNASTQTITNNIDLSGEGGLVWTKHRNGASQHALFDTERGVLKGLASSSTAAEANETGSVTAFNSNGYTLGSWSGVNGSSNTYVSWTFRKAPKFFDVVTYTGNGVAGRTISHNLDNLVGMLIIKCTSHSSDWSVQHRMVLPSKYLALNETTSAQTDTARFHSTAASSSSFTVGSGNAVNGSGRTYVAYLFAHHNSGNQGDFGPDSDQDVIKCGSFTNSGSTVSVNLGFEPQFIMFKRYSNSGSWFVADSMRGIINGSTDPSLVWNSSAAESNTNAWDLTATGFDINGAILGSGDYIYMAIRRGPLAEPTSATDVFHVQAQSDGSTYSVGFPTDLLLHAKRNGSTANAYVATRLLGDDKYLSTNSSSAEGTASGVWSFDLQNSFDQGATTSNPHVNWHWKRAPSYFDVVAYSGTGSARTVSHNLGAVPEMMWVKCRSEAQDWVVYHKGMDSSAPEDYGSYLNDTVGRVNSANFWNDTAPTSSVFTVGTAAKSNGSSKTYIAYLFATVAGVSKVGSVSHSFNSTTNVDCGFSSGARFVLVKSTSTGDWYVWDSVRGIVSGNDPYLALNKTDAEVTNGDLIDPYSGGFALSPSFYTDTYIFYAIA